MSELAHPARLAALRRTGLLEPGSDPTFERLCRLTAHLVGAPGAVFALVAARRQYLKCGHGLAEPWSGTWELPLDHGFCPEVVEAGAPVVVDDARQHALGGPRADGDTLGMVAFAGVPIRFDGHVVGVLAVFDREPRAWTDREQEILEALADSVMRQIEVQVRTGEAQDAVRRREEVLNVIAHDLRNPVGAIAGSVQLLRMLDLDEAQTDEQLQLIERSAQRMFRLIEDLLEVSRLESGRYPLELEPVTLDEILGEVVARVATRAEESGVALEVDEAPPDVRVAADRERLARVVENLVDNGLKFTDPGGRVSVSAFRDGSGCGFRVRDTGRGIEPDDIPLLFDRYFQTRRDGRKGAGLGLAMARGITEVHGGTLRVESAPGEGSLFEVELPLDDPPAEVSPAPDRAAS